MSRRKQIVIVISAVLLGVASVPAGVVGYFYLENQRMKTEMVKIVKDHHQELMNYMQGKQVDPHHRVKTFTVEYEKTEHSPMGGIMVYGYVNHNKKYAVSLMLDKEDVDDRDKLEVVSSSTTIALEEKLGGLTDD